MLWHVLPPLLLLGSHDPMLFYDALHCHSPIVPNIQLLIVTSPPCLPVSPHPNFSGYFGDTAFGICHWVHYMGSVLAHLVRVLLLQDMNFFGGVTLACHLLHDESATSHLMNGWFLHLAFCDSLSMYLCIDEGLLWRLAFQCAPPHLSL